MKNKLIVLLVLLITIVSCTNKEDPYKDCLQGYCVVTYKDRPYLADSCKVVDSTMFFYVYIIGEWISQDSLELDRRCYGNPTH